MLLAIVWIVLWSGRDLEAEHALSSAAQSSQGNAVLVRVIEVDVQPSDEAALELARNAGADSVASVVWADPRHLRVQLRAHSSARGWLEREIEFAPGDAPAEQGRTLGFNLASMLAAEAPPGAPPNAPAPSAATATPTTETPAVPAPSPEPAATPAAANAASAPAAPPAPVAGAATQAGSATPVEPAKATPAAEREPATRPADREQTFSGSLSTAFSMDTALGGEGDGIGGALGGQFDLSRHLGLRLDLALRTGPIGALHATGLELEAIPGIAWSPLSARPDDAWTVALQLGLFARYHAIFRPASMARGPETRGRVLPGAALTAAGTFWFARELGLLVRAGAESAFGKTELYVGQRSVATLVPLSLVLELGFSARF